MKKIMGLIVAVALIGGGYFIWLEVQKTESTDDAEIDGNVVAISSRVAGHVSEVLVQDGQVVNKGDVLVKLDPKDFEIAVERAKADLNNELANLQTSRSDVPLTTATTASTLNGARSTQQDAAEAISYAEQQQSVAQARLSLARANVKVADANANKTAQDVERYKALVAKDEISKQQYDQAVAAAEAAKATVDAQQAAVVEAQHAVGAADVAVRQARAKLGHAEAEVQTALTGPQRVTITQSQVAVARAKVAQRQADLDQALLNLQYTTVTAPIGGVIGKKNINPGQNVAVGQQMMAIVPLEDLWVTANFKETQLKDMRVGQKVKLSVDAYGRDYTGTVQSIAGASGAKFSLLPPENATGNFVKVVQRIPVRIAFDPGQTSDHLLRPGMSVVPSVRVR
ncbi:MAG: HlyD family secretion protein [Acidobacteriota bacterium]